MMDRLREGVNSIAVKIILGLIILSFLFAGIGSYLVNGGSDVAAKVGSTDISRNDFEQSYQNRRNRMQVDLATRGEDVSALLSNPNYVNMLRQQVLSEMVNTEVLDQYAASLGLTVTDEQVRQAILESPEFQKDGKFDQETYQRLLNQVGLSVDDYAESLRSNLLRNQLVVALQASDFALAGETEAQNKRLTQTRDIRQVTISAKQFADKITLSDDEIQAYYDQHPEKFTRPEQYKLSYLELSAQQLVDKQTVSDEEMQQYYQENQERYSTPEQRQISHILLKDEQDAQAVLAKIHDGADFATLAKQRSEDSGSAKEGGSLGWIQAGSMDEHVEDAAFGLSNVGDVSDVVQSNFGYHIVKLDAVKPAQVKPFDDVKAAIKQELIEQKAADQFYALSNQLEQVAFDSPNSLDDAAQAIKQDVQVTEFVSQQAMPEVLNNEAVMQAIQSPEVQEDGMNSEVIEVAPEHVVVVHVNELRPEMVLPLQEVKDQVVAQLSQEKGEQQVSELAKNIIAELQDGHDELLAQQKLAFGDVESIDRSSPLAQTVFAMAKPLENSATFAQAPAANGGDITIIKLEAVKDAPNADLNDAIKQQLSQINAQNSWMDVLNTQRENTDIQYYSVSQ